MTTRCTSSKRGRKGLVNKIQKESASRTPIPGRDKVLQRAMVNIVRQNDKNVDLTKKVLEVQKKQLEIAKRTAAYRAKMATTPPKGITPSSKFLDKTALPMSMLPGTDINRKKVRSVGMGPGFSGLAQPKQSLTERASAAGKMAKSFLSEANARRKSTKFGIKASIAALGSFVLMKKILGKLEESSGYLGAVFKILGKTFLLALMPIATVLGALLMPTALEMLGVVRDLLNVMKGDLGKLIGGEMSGGEFIEKWGPAITQMFASLVTIVTEAFVKLALTLISNIPAIVGFLYTMFIAMITGIINAFGITWEEFRIGLLVVIGAFLVGLAAVLMGAPVLLAVTIVAFVVSIAAVLMKISYEAGVKFGNFLRNLEEKLNGIPAKILSVFNGLIAKISNLNPFRGGSGGGSSSKSSGGGSSGSSSGSGGKKGLFGKIIDKIWPFADGGIVTGPTLGLLGEAGPEAVVPLGKGGGMGGGNYNFSISIDQPQISSDMDIEDIAHKVSSIIYDDVRRSTTW